VAADLDEAPCGYLRFDERGTIVRCNVGLAKLVGRSVESLIGARIELLFGVPGRIFLLTHVMPTLCGTGETRELQIDLRTEAGRDVPVLWNAVMRPGPEPRAIDVVVVEMAGRAEYEAELLRARRAADEARRERERAVEQLVQLRKFESLSSVAGGIAHDFNNLLCVILGNTHLLQEEFHPHHPARPLLTEVDEAARRAAALSGQMLAYSGRAQLVLAPLALEAALQELRPAVEGALPAGTHIAWELARDRATIDGDRDQLRSLLGSLLQNAVDALPRPDAPIVVRTSTRTVDADELAGFHPGSSAGPGRYALIEVVDRGHGIGPEARSRLFEPFFSTKAVGRGLGLAAALGITRSHRGAIRVESAAGLGTTVTVALPVRVPPSPSPTQTASHDATQGKVVLVVDDEAALLTLLARGLGRMGFEVVTAGSGAAALARFAERPDIVCALLDFDLPDTSGVTLLATLREQRPELPAVLMSGLGAAVLLAQVGALHRTDFRGKPFTVREIGETLLGLLRVPRAGI
jgi:two-component system cell cycle sensor histidine kinase/response regulator CckA